MTSLYNSNTVQNECIGFNAERGARCLSKGEQARVVTLLEDFD